MAVNADQVQNRSNQENCVRSEADVSASGLRKKSALIRDLLSEMGGNGNGKH